MLLLLGNSLLYSLPPLRLKRVFIFSKLFPALNSLAAVMLGYIFAGGALLQFPAPLVWYFLIFATLIFNFLDIKDCKADKQRGIATLPVILGLSTAKLAIAGVCLIGYCMVSFIFLDLRLLFPTFFLGVVQFFFITRKNYSEKPVLVVHLSSVILLVLYLAFVRVPF